MAQAVEIYSSGRAKKFKWVLTAADPTADPSPPILNQQDKTVQCYGTTDANGWNTATITIDGSTDKSVGYATLNDPQGNALVFTNQNKIETIQENVDQIKPVVTGTLGANGVTVVLTCGGQY